MTNGGAANVEPAWPPLVDKGKRRAPQITASSFCVVSLHALVDGTRPSFVGIVFSKEARNFARRVEANIDLERTAILNDLSFDGAVERFSLVPRPTAERQFKNSPGNLLVTDGGMAVVVLRMPAALTAC